MQYKIFPHIINSAVSWNFIHQVVLESSRSWSFPIADHVF